MSIVVWKEHGVIQNQRYSTDLAASEFARRLAGEGLPCGVNTNNGLVVKFTPRTKVEVNDQIAAKE